MDAKESNEFVFKCENQISIVSALAVERER